jgi:DNA-binding FadR family transcriptional regulator
VTRLHIVHMRHLLAAISSGELPSGSPLPREADLAADLGASRAVVRSAIQGLVDRGVVRVTHGRGQYVRPSEDWNTLDREVIAALLGGPGAKRLLSEVIETRLVLEVPAAGLAAERADASSIEMLRAAFQRMAETAKRPTGVGGRDRYREAEAAFGRVLIAAVRNRPLLTAVTALQEAVALSGVVDARREQTLADYDRILTAVAASDSERTRDAMCKHLEGIADLVAKRRPSWRTR